MAGKERKPVIIIFCMALGVGILSRMKPSLILKSFLYGAIEPITLKLIALVILVIFLGNLLKEKGNLKNFVSSLGVFIKDSRLSLVIPPALIGLLPMPAGAMFSAPMVAEYGEKMNLNPEEKTFLNFWFRHVWEYSWPLYTGLILTAGIVGVPIRRIIFTQYPLTLAAIFAGFILGIRKILPDKLYLNNEKRDFTGGLRSLFVNTWPILAVILLVIIFKVELTLSLIIIISLFLITAKMEWGKVSQAIKRSLNWGTILLIIAVMIFKKILETSGILVIIPQISNYLNLSPFFILIFLPFLLGLLTGIPTGFVGPVIPLFLPFIGETNPNLNYVMLIYAGGFAGVLLSPFHLCLFLTKSYFGASFKGVYKLLWMPVSFVLFVAIIIVFIRQLFV